MTRALVVEDHAKWQRFHRDCLESILGKGNVDVTDNYEDAVSMLNLEYGLYVIDRQFLNHLNGDLYLLGIQLAEAIRNKEGSYDKIVMVSSSEDSLSKAQSLGIIHVYNKSSLNADKKEILRFERCIRNILLGVNLQ